MDLDLTAIGTGLTAIGAGLAIGLAAIGTGLAQGRIGSAGAQTSEIIDSVRMTKREKQVIELISEGHTNKEIAQELHLSTYTVKSHVHNILEKLALSTRVQIAKLSARFKENRLCQVIYFSSRRIIFPAHKK